LQAYCCVLYATEELSFRVAPLSLRILIVAHGHPELRPGGGEIASYLLFRGLQRVAGIEAHYLAWVEAAGAERVAGRLSSFAGRPRESVICTGEFNSFWLSQPSVAVLDQFALLLARIDPDVVHFHHYTNLGIEFIAAARQHKPELRLVVTLHEYLAICHHYGTMVKTSGFALCRAASDEACAACFPGIPAGDFGRRRQYVQAHFASVDRFVAPSEFLRQRYIEWGVPAARIIALANGIEPVRRPPPRRSAAENCAVFGFFGQIHPFKGLIELLTAFHHLDQLRPTAAIRLMIHGAYLESNHRDYIALFRDLLAKTAARVHFAGPYARRDLYRLIAAVDWVVVPSIWWENSPLVIEEALAHRRPVVCSAIGGMAEKVRPGKDGFQFPVGDAFELARLILRLAEDGTVWDALQSTMRQPATVAETVARHLSVYRDDAANPGFAQNR
jgi:glycosyltransferase involved in cell wall biosynthesis